MHNEPEVPSHRRVDVASLLLLLVGLASAWFCYRLAMDHGTNPLMSVSSTVAVTVGARHITKREAAWPLRPGTPAAGHVTSRGAWHPGAIRDCSKCADR